MKICFICNEYPEGPHGGIGTMTKLLAEELIKFNHEVKIIGVYDNSYPSPDQETYTRLEITRLRADKKSSISVFKAFWILGKIVRKWSRENEIDIIECPDSYGLISILPKFGVPVVLRAHGNNTYFSSILNLPIKKKTLFYEWNLYRKSSGYSAVSAFTADKMRSLYHIKKPIAIIYNGLDTSKESQSSNLSLTNFNQLSFYQNPIVFSGTLTPKKGIYELVKSVIQILETGVDTTLIINGKDTVNQSTGFSVKAELIDLIPESLQQKFIFNGHITRDELICQYINSKAAIFPSFAEAFALAPMEAMLVGTPTIYSDTCSGNELIINKIDGLLINPNSIESIVEAISFILTHPIEAKIIGEKGREKIIRYFSKEIMAQKTLQFYENIRTSYNN